MVRQSVRLGEHNIDSDPDCDPINAADCADSPVDIKVERVIVHPAYRTGTADEYNDISLLRLSRDAPLSGKACFVQRLTLFLVLLFVILQIL